MIDAAFEALFDEADLAVADAIARHGRESDPAVLLGAALAVRATRFGHVCVRLDDVARSLVSEDLDVSALPWPEPRTWLDALAASPVVRNGPDGGRALLPLVLDDGRLYLERYWRAELAVAEAVRARRAARDVSVPPGAGTDLQARAVEVAAAGRMAVIAGGPGTGKTYTVATLLARLVDAAAAQGRELEVALAAPTGKAAARLTESIRGRTSLAGLPAAATIHRMLTEPRLRRAEVVIVDEASMISLPLMARLVATVPERARLVLVGDPYQLASIEAGAVLGDVVAAGGDDVVVLDRVRRFGATSTIATLADAVRRGEAAEVLEVLAGAHPDVGWVRPDEPTALGGLRRAVVEASVPIATAALEGRADDGLAAANDTKVLAATRRGPHGVHAWSELIEAGVARREPRLAPARRFAPGQPILVTRNDRLHGLVNGDTGLVVPGDRGEPEVAFADGRRFLPAQLSATEPWWAMTIHKSQGSEYRHVVVSLPDAGSPMLTRELLYTAITRAVEQVTVLGSPEAITEAVGRPIARASGLAERL